MEQLEFSYIIGKSDKLYSHFGKNSGNFYKNKHTPKPVI